MLSQTASSLDAKNARLFLDDSLYEVVLKSQGYGLGAIGGPQL